MSDEAKSWDELGGLDDAVDLDEESSEESAEDSPVLAERKIRDLQKRDLQVIKQLISEYPKFKSLPPGDQLDRIVLVLETVCGFGAISEQTIQQFQVLLPFSSDIVPGHLNTATYSHEGVTKRRYREPFPGGYCLEREFKKILASEGNRSSQDEPIRKKVAAKRVETPPPQPTRSRQASISARAPVPTPAPTAPVQQDAKPVLDEKVVIKPVLSTPLVDNKPMANSTEAPRRQHLWILGAVIVAVLILAVFRTIR